MTSNKTIVRLRRRIVPNWRSRLGDWSTKALAFGAAVAAAWVALPTDLKTHLPVDYVAWAVGALNFFGLGAKFVTQGDQNADK